MSRDDERIAGSITHHDLSARIDALGPWFHNIDLNGVATAPEHFLGDYPQIILLLLIIIKIITVSLNFMTFPGPPQRSQGLPGDLAEPPGRLPGLPGVPNARWSFPPRGD